MVVLFDSIFSEERSTSRLNTDAVVKLSSGDVLNCNGTCGNVTEPNLCIARQGSILAILYRQPMNNHEQCSSIILKLITPFLFGKNF